MSTNTPALDPTVSIANRFWPTAIFCNFLTAISEAIVELAACSPGFDPWLGQLISPPEPPKGSPRQARVDLVTKDSASFATDRAEQNVFRRVALADG